MSKGKGKGKSSASSNGSHQTLSNGATTAHSNGNSSAVESSVFSLNPALTSTDMVEGLRRAWKESETFESKEIGLMQTPFTCCTVKNLLKVHLE